MIQAIGHSQGNHGDFGDISVHLRIALHEVLPQRSGWDVDIVE